LKDEKHQQQNVTGEREVRGVILINKAAVRGRKALKKKIREKVTPTKSEMKGEKKSDERAGVEKQKSRKIFSCFALFSPLHWFNFSLSRKTGGEVFDASSFDDDVQRRRH
jgi:hypothetical protein